MPTSSLETEMIHLAKVGESFSIDNFDTMDQDSEQPAKQAWVRTKPASQATADVGGLENSPFLMVRAAVPPTDDPEMPVNTIRMWTIGLVSVVFGSAFNTILGLRSPPVNLSGLVAQFAGYYVGVSWAKWMPKRVFNTFGMVWTLNPGPFNYKEHTCISVMSSVGFGSDYVSNFIVTQEHFYKQRFGLTFQLMLAWTVQLLGLSMAGLARRFLVYPASAVWPAQLVHSTFIHALHTHREPEAPPRWKGVTRFKLFIVVLFAAFLWHFFPLFIFPALSAPVFLTWIWPQNVTINQLFGGSQGLGLLPLTFDWNVVTGYLGSPLVMPWHATANTLIGVLFIFVIGSIGVSYSNTWYADYVTISESSSYDNMQMPYNATRLLTSNFVLNVTEYEKYSPLFLPTNFALAYGVSFAAIASTVPYIYLYHGASIRRQFFRRDTDDIHMKLMRAYEDTPDWWYGVLFVAMAAMTLAVALAWPTQLSWWALLICLLIAACYIVPFGIISSITTITIGLNVLTEFVIGYLQPGKPIAMMLFKTYGYITMSQALTFTGDIKLAHYMKVPQRKLFWVQLIATFVGATVDVAAVRLAMSSIPGICTRNAFMRFNCPQARVFFTASIIWGLLGPSRIFSLGKVYGGLLCFFPIGFILPILVWLVYRKYPQSWLRYVNIPVLFAGSGNMPPATVLNFGAFGVVAWIFNYQIKRKQTRWWIKYNYILSCGLDLGLYLCTIFLALAFGLNGVRMPDWWGTTVGQDTLESTTGAIRKVLAEGQTFGPPAGSWH